MIVALPGLFSYLFFIILTVPIQYTVNLSVCCSVQFDQCNLISGYTARGLTCVVHSVQSGMCGPLCIAYYHAVLFVFFVFVFVLFSYTSSLVLNVLLSTMTSIFTAQVQNILLVYYLFSHKGSEHNIHMYSFGTISCKKTEHSLICILAEIRYHLDHGKKLTNEYPGLMKEPVIKSVFI